MFFITFKRLSLKYIKTIFFEGESATINLFCIMVFLQGFTACVSVAFVFIFHRCSDTWSNPIVFGSTLFLIKEHVYQVFGREFEKIFQHNCLCCHMLQLSCFELEAPILRVQLQHSCFFLKSPALKWSWVKCQILVNLIASLTRITLYKFDVKILAATMIDIIFWDLLIHYQIFFSPQVKRSMFINNKHGIYELLHDLLNDFRIRILGN